jgi:hypothetical protein
VEGGDPHEREGPDAPDFFLRGDVLGQDGTVHREDVKATLLFLKRLYPPLAMPCGTSFHLDSRCPDGRGTMKNVSYWHLHP